MRPITRFSILALAGLLAACASSSSGDEQQVNNPPPGGNPPLQKLFTASDYLYQEVPARAVVGADNYVSTGSNIKGSNEFHYSGKDCLRCHTEGATGGAPNKAAAKAFTMAGTVYKDILGTEPLAGAEVVIMDSEGTVLSMTTNAAGNFMTDSPIADADPSPTVTNRMYKTWILGPDGKILPMVTMTSGSCNMHHTPFNRRGAMWAGKWSASPDAATATTVEYTKHVAPIFAAKCVPCHVPAPDAEKNIKEPLKRTAAMTADPVYDYTGGFDLVQYDSFIDDFEDNDPLTIESKTAPSGRKYVMLTDDPATAHDDREDSLILAKMLAPETGHGGGKLAADRNDPDYRTILRWLQQGAPGPAHE